VRIAILGALAVAAPGCEVGERMLCLDLGANQVDRVSGCVSPSAVSVPAERCAPCPDRQCGVDLACARSSCVVSPDGGVYLIPCLDARQRSWPEGWRPLGPSEAVESPDLSEEQRTTCSSSAPWNALCFPGRP
jgi:hypothetical protein